MRTNQHRRMGVAGLGALLLLLIVAVCSAPACAAEPQEQSSPRAGADAQAAPATPAADPTQADKHEPDKAKDSAKDKEKDKGKADGDDLSVTHHSITVGGKVLNYTATAGTMLLKNDADKPWAHFFFVAYELDHDKAFDPHSRPITFVFNGGPGAAAVWLHIGSLGPKRIELGADGLPPQPPYHIVDNQETWLPTTDLVFIDPVGTGYSRPATGVDGKEFFGVHQDIASVAAFIRLYVTRNQRWLSPKFLAGESYGTTRAAGLSEYLLDRYGLDLNGIVLISAVLNFQTIQSNVTNDLPTVLFLPSLTATAWHHHKLDAALQKDFDKTIVEVQQWTISEYLPALAQGDTLSAARRESIVDRLVRYTGLPRDYIARTDLRLSARTFRAKLLDDERLILGRFDARVTGANPSPDASGGGEYDPSLSRYLPVYTATFNDYVRGELKYVNDSNYEVLSGKARWSMSDGDSGYLEVASNLRSAILKNPHLRVMFASGYYDLATPFFGTGYTVNRMDLGNTLRANVTQQFYPGGHMMYHVAAAREKLVVDADAFYRSATRPPAKVGE